MEKSQSHNLGDIACLTCVAITANKAILVSTYTQIFKVTQAGQKYKAVVIAGSGEANRLDGKPDECRFYFPLGLAVDEASHLCFVADYYNHSIRKISFANTG